MRLLFSIWVWTACFVVMGIDAVLTLLLTLFVPYQKVHRRLTSPLMGFCVRLTFSRFAITYDPAFDPERRGVFCQNHVNLLDAHVSSAVIPHPFCGLMNAWHFKVPFYGWLMWVSKGIPVNHGRHRMLDDMIEGAKDRAAQGMSVLTFPEAHRTRTGQVGPFKKGVFVMAREAGLPVVPICVRGMFDVNRKGSWLFRPGRVEVYVGKQVETAGVSEADIMMVADEVRATMVRFVEQADPRRAVRKEAA